MGPESTNARATPQPLAMSQQRQPDCASDDHMEAAGQGIRGVAGPKTCSE